MAFYPKHDPASLFYQKLSDVIRGKKGFVFVYSLRSLRLCGEKLLTYPFYPLHPC